MTNWNRILQLAESTRSPNAVALLELRARVEALEAGATCPHIVTSDEGTSYCGLAEAIANMQQQDEDADRAMELASAANSKSTCKKRQIRNSLVERVAVSIADDCDVDVWHDIACAAIKAIVAELRDHGSPTVADWLEQEAKR